MFAVQHIRAENDRNGNPRRCFVLYKIAKDSATIAQVRNEGYSGLPREWATYPRLADVAVAPAEYRAFLKL